MKYTKSSFVLAASLFVLPLVNAFGQSQVKEPGTFDPQTSSAHQEFNGQDAAALPALPSAEMPAVKTPGRVIIPASSVVRPEDAGLRAHTNHVVFVPASKGPVANGMSATSMAAVASVTPATTFSENPGSLACVDGLISYAGCTYSGGFSKHPTGGSGAIVIVDAYHNPDAASDLATFDAEWGLPAVNFTQIYCQPYNNGSGTCYTTNTPPATNTGWGLEEALDIEYSHAMAPSAKIILIEAASSSYADLTWANAWAGYYADINGGGEVSNSWGGSEFSTEATYDKYFNNYSGSYHPVVYLASGGDSSTIEYPSASPYVISAGGTTINRDSSGNYLSQTCWSGTGRGTSAYETIPAFQSAVGGLAGTKRLTNDLSSDADPASGVWVYDALNGGWFTVGGTSVAAPTLAGIINNAGNFMSSTVNEGNLLYSEFKGVKSYSANFYDASPAGYDNCTGIGVPKGLVGK